MNKPIRSYEELLSYKADLEVLVREKRLVIYEDLQIVHEEVAPFFSIARKIIRLFKPKSDHALFAKGAMAILNILVGNLAIRKSGWLGQKIINGLYRLTHRTRYEKII